MVTKEVNWILEQTNVFSLAMLLIRKDIVVIILLVRRYIPPWMPCSGNTTYIFQQHMRGIKNQSLQRFSIFSLRTALCLKAIGRISLFTHFWFNSMMNSSQTVPLLQSDQSILRCQNQKKEIELFYEILPALKMPSALLPHRSPAEDIIQVTPSPETKNINEIYHDDLIS
ncbi:unnamed protein product [Prunus brigantina]